MIEIFEPPQFRLIKVAYLFSRFWRKRKVKIIFDGNIFVISLDVINFILMENCKPALMTAVLIFGLVIDIGLSANLY